MAIDWSLAKQPDIIGNALAAFQQGEKMGDQIRRRKAVKAFTDNPDDPKALSSLMEADPELGFRASEYQRKRAQDQRDTRFNEAATALVSGDAAGDDIPNSHTALRDAPPEARRTTAAPRAGMNALAAMGPASIPMQGMNALAAFTSPPGRWQSPDEARQLPDSRQEQSPISSIVSVVGKPANREDALFLKMFQADPKRALEMESALRDRLMDRLKDEHDGIGYGLTALAGVDAATWGQRRAHIMQRLAPLKLNLEAVLPEQYPGEEAVRQIQMQGMGLKDQLATLISQDRAEVYADDIDADNERADRNTDSIIADRAARRGENRRYHDQRDRTTRRGQDKRGSGRLVQVKTRAEAAALPSGTKFRDPNGVVRTRA